ncbi:MAG TPA: phosphoribosylglycinamide formyltransferase [Thermoanaerobaculia bacterium]|nr:phosphoribosylglycinamide formyltransferase [Thermoanaerobaculia bacterium]
MRLAVLLSGRGSNFAAIREALAAGRLEGSIVVVISNRAGAPGLAKARSWGYTAHVIDERQFEGRSEHEEAVRRALDAAAPDFIVLAGYMRLLSPSFVASYPSRILNIHPSLLPAFPGVNAQAQALAHGVKISGCTVHFVDEGLDAGPIIVQRAVEVLDDDTVETLSLRILAQEHVAYVEALRLLGSGAYRIEGRRVVAG